MSWQIMSDWYHAAPTADRERVRTHGLIPADPKQNPFWYREQIEEQPPGVYLSPNSVDLPEFERDVWKIDPRHIDESQLQRDWIWDRGAQIYPHPVPPEALQLHRPYEEEMWKNKEHYDPDLWEYENQLGEGNPWGIGRPNRVWGKTADALTTPNPLAPIDELTNFINTRGNPTSLINPNNPLGQSAVPSANQANPKLNPANPQAFNNPANPELNPHIPGSTTNPSNPAYNPNVPGATNNPANTQFNPAYPNALNNASSPEFNPYYPSSLTNPAAPVHNPDYPDPEAVGRPPTNPSPSASYPPNPWRFGSAAPKPPNLREATGSEHCGNCKMFNKGKCWGYGNYGVDSDDVCDSWAKETKTSAWHFSDKRVAQSDDELCVMLDIPDHARNKIHKWVKEQDWPKGTDLHEPDDYHITLMYTPGGYSEHKDADWIEHVDNVKAKIIGVHAFPESPEDGYPYVLRIESPEIKERAKEMQSRAEDHGLEITRFPGGYKPHLTVGYGPEATPDIDNIEPLEFEAGPSRVSEPRGEKTSAWRFGMATVPDELWEDDPRYRDRQFKCQMCKGKGYVTRDGAECPRCEGFGFLPPLYHLAPRSERGNIRNLGLVPHQPSHQNWPKSDPAKIQTQPSGVYLNDNPVATYEGMSEHRAPYDVWRINPNRIEPQQDPIWYDSVYTPAPVAPNHIQLAWPRRRASDDGLGRWWEEQANQWGLSKNPWHVRNQMGQGVDPTDTDVTSYGNQPKGTGNPVNYQGSPFKPPFRGFDLLPPEEEDTAPLGYKWIPFSEQYGEGYTTPHRLTPKNLEWQMLDEYPEGTLGPVHQGAWQKMSDYYHVAPTTERARIQQHGLQPSWPPYNPEWEIPMTAEDPFPEGVYAFPEAGQADWYREQLDDARQKRHDIWRIPEGEHEWQIDPDITRARYTPQIVSDPQLHYGPENNDALWPPLPESHDWEFVHNLRRDYGPYKRQMSQNEWGVGLPDRVIGKRLADNYDCYTDNDATGRICTSTDPFWSHSSGSRTRQGIHNSTWTSEATNPSRNKEQKSRICSDHLSSKWGEDEYSSPSSDMDISSWHSPLWDAHSSSQWNQGRQSDSQLGTDHSRREHPLRGDGWFTSARSRGETQNPQRSVAPDQGGLSQRRETKGYSEPLWGYPSRDLAHHSRYQQIVGDAYTLDTREWPDPTEPRASKPPEPHGCTCPQGHKLDCPIHGMNPVVDPQEIDHSWSVPQANPTGYPQDGKTWTFPFQSAVATMTSSQMAANHFGQIPGDENLDGPISITKENPNSGVNLSYMGTVNNTPVYIKPEGNFHEDDLAKERAAFMVAHTMGVPMPHTVVRHIDEGRPAQIQTSLGGRSAMAYYPEELYEQYPEDYRRIALLDSVIANRDRHHGNMVIGDDGRLYPIDHGGAFGERAVPSGPFSWHEGTELTPDEIEGLRRARLLDLSQTGLTQQHQDQMTNRIDNMLRYGTMRPNG